MKYRRLTNKPPLTATQLQNRKRRRIRDYIMRFGMPTPKGTQPRWGPIGEPILNPMPVPYRFDPIDLIMTAIGLMPWMRRRRKESQLAEQRRAESIKAQGR